MSQVGAGDRGSLGGSRLPQNSARRSGLGSSRQWEILLARRYRRTGAAPLHEEVVRPPRTRRGKREYPLLGNRLVRTATCGVAHRLPRSFCEEFSADTSQVGTAAKKNLSAVPLRSASPWRRFSRCRKVAYFPVPGGNAELGRFRITSGELQNLSHAGFQDLTPKTQHRKTCS